MEPWVEQLIKSAVVVAGGYVAYRLIDRAGQRYVKRFEDKGIEKAARADTLWIFSRRVIVVAVLLVVVLTVLAVWEFSLTPVVAVGTVLGAAIGFGAQDLVKDLIAGFFILAEDQFQVGDVVEIAGVAGVVQDIQFRVTVLRDLEGNVHFVPNGQIQVSSNFTSQFAQPIVDVGVAYGEDVDNAMAVLKDELEMLAADPEWSPMITGEVELFGVQDLGDSAVLLRARLTTTAEDRWTVQREARRRVKNRFDAEDIEIPFPHMTIYRGDS